jgi:hypothetical protein
MSGRRARGARAIALGDQAQAAAEHANRTLLGAAAANPNLRLTYVKSAFLTSKALEAAKALEHGTASRCSHVDPARPAVVHAWASTPTILRCMPCAEEDARPRAGSRDDLRCDRCGDTEQGVHPGAVSFGTILLTYGFCEACTDAAQMGATG